MSFNKYWTAIAIVATTLAYSNCGSMKSSSNSLSFNSSTAHSIGPDGVLYSVTAPHRTSVDLPLIFFSNASHFGEPVRRILWDHNFNGTDYCDQQTHDDQWKFEVTCGEPGQLNVFMIVEYESGVDEFFSATVEVFDEAQQPPGPSVPGPTTPVVLDGKELFNLSCSGCHAPTAKRGRSSAQIQSAIDNNVGKMGFLSVLSPAEVKAISDYLNE